MNQQIKELALKFKDCKERNKKLAAEMKKLDEEWLAVESELMEVMIEEGCKSAELAGIGLVSLRVKNYMSVTEANKDQFIEYLDKIGHSDLVKRDVSKAVATEFLDTHLDEIIRTAVEDREVDMVTARNEALEFLKTVGVSYFTKRDIALKG